MIDPVFCLSWPEAVVADQLQRTLPKRGGYSVWIPVSRQMPGIDLAIFRSDGPKHKTLTVQVKASRIYAKTSDIQYDTLFKCFPVAPEANYVALVWPNPPAHTTSSQRRRHTYCTLFFEQSRIRQLMESCQTRKGKQDFGFGFVVMRDSRILWKRGNVGNDATDYSEYLLENQIEKVKSQLG
jgi:hypothetical protein